MYGRREFRPSNYGSRDRDGDRDGRRDRNDRRRRFDDDDTRSNKVYSDEPRRFDRDRDQETESTMIEVPSSNIGRIIGRGGSKIRELQDDSGARINIDKSGGGSMTKITISGSSHAQTKAVDLINEFLDDNRSDNRNDDRRNDGYQRDGSSRNSYNPPRNSYVPKFETPQYDDSQPWTTSSGNDKELPAVTKEDLENTQVDWQALVKECDRQNELKWAKLPPIVKHFYNEDPEVANFSDEKVREIRQQNNNIDVSYLKFKEGEPDPEEKIPNPILTFEQAFKDYPDILKEVYKQGFKEPSPIQKQAWPILLSGKDMIGIAQTGTGKTLAFLLPALIHIDGQSEPLEKRAGPNVLVLAPTRELALQIEKEVAKYSYKGIKAVCVYGGGSRNEQINRVKEGVQIVIATPGRLNDLTDDNILDTSCVTYLILDEADRMLDMGFEPQIRRTLLGVRPTRQTIMTSATWPQGVRRLAKSYMKNPIQVNVGSLDLAATHSVKQTVYILAEEEKEEMLYRFIENMTPDDKVIIFFGKKARVDNFSSDMALRGLIVQSIHGSREQSDREQALEDIKEGRVNILLATDVASRGIDIEDITYVFNYDFPRDIEEYVHRVGRTGRAGRSGESITLMTRNDWSHASELIKILEEAVQEVPEELYNMAKRYDAMKEKRANERQEFGGGGGRRFGGGGRGGGGGGRRNRW